MSSETATGMNQSMLETVRSHLNHYLFDLSSWAGRTTNYCILLLIVATVFLSMMDTVDEYHILLQDFLPAIEAFILYFFLLEYALRVFSAHKRLKYIKSFHGMIDLITILPLIFGLHSSILIRLLRLIRLFKITMYFPLLVNLFESIAGSLALLFAVLGTTTLISVIIGNIIFIVEPSTFPNAFAGTWWSLVTMSTVGYGDYVPQSVVGKLLAAFLILIGICMFAMVTAVISVRVGRMVHMDTKCMECNTSISSEYRYCPFCGSDQDDSIDLF
ncbi:MAG: ion transporter [Zetaproteobacteria bacterium]|nr:ion transporter [Zetaproteobacteria bacterium]